MLAHHMKKEYFHSKVKFNMNSDIYVTIVVLDLPLKYYDFSEGIADIKF